MLHIYCPHCGEYREEEEFHPRGQAHIARPANPDQCSDEVWGTFLYFRKNPRGLHHELWVHSAGCRKFFNLVRDTQTYEIKQVYTLNEQPESREHA